MKRINGNNISTQFSPKKLSYLDRYSRYKKRQPKPCQIIFGATPNLTSRTTSAAPKTVKMFSSVTGTGHFGYYDIQYKIHLEAPRLTIAGRKRSFCRLIATREAIVGFCNCWRSGRPCPATSPHTRLQRHVTTNPTKPLYRIFKNMGRSITSLSTKMTT